MQQKLEQIQNKETEIGFCVSPNPQRNNNNGGAFLPFSKDRNGSCPSPTLALASPDGKDLEEKKSLEIVNLGNKCSIATPKQIRELMKVDGLTNDEVKSHLQLTDLPFPSPDIYRTRKQS
nr:myb family transcription factor EFM-like [Ipomoea batatas]